jgi:cell division protein ZapE
VHGPLAQYRALVDEGNLTPDDQQSMVIDHLDSLYQRLLSPPDKLWDRLRRRRNDVRGVYLHGQVGRGKTMLMDLFTTSVRKTGTPVWRIHFHRFMDHVHSKMGRLEKQRDPLKLVARQVSGRARVLCLDEFHVGDIGDAMILGELLRTLFELRVVLVTTSNTEPDQLYADGLQRARFLPAIHAIKTHCEVICLDSREDYRLRELVRHPVYYCPDDEQARKSLAEEFYALAAGETVSTAPLKIRGHRIEPLRRAGSVAWFDFATLCEGPRANADYIELSRRFGTLIISEIPQLGEGDNDAARRFIHLVDECYDRAVKLIITAAVAPQDLYTGKRLVGPFERTVSRLIEMQSRDYLALPHRP